MRARHRLGRRAPRSGRNAADGRDGAAAEGFAGGAGARQGAGSTRWRRRSAPWPISPASRPRRRPRKGVASMSSAPAPPGRRWARERRPPMKRRSPSSSASPIWRPRSGAEAAAGARAARNCAGRRCGGDGRGGAGGGGALQRDLPRRRARGRRSTTQGLDTQAPGAAKVELVRRASVTQRTGEDWSDVALTLSTTRVAGGTGAPEVGTLALNLREPITILETSRQRTLAAPAPMAAPQAEADAVGRGAPVQAAQERKRRPRRRRSRPAFPPRAGSASAATGRHAASGCRRICSTLH